MTPESEGSALRRIPTKLPPAAAADVGSVLLQARTKKGHSIEVVSQHTRIAKKYIEAMEANRFEDFPALPYLRGFLKCYCEYLDVEFEPLWAKAFPPEPAPQATETAEAPEPSPKESSSGGGWVLAAGAAILAGLLFLLARKGEKAEPPPQPEAATPAALQPIYSPPEPHLAIEFKGDSWVRIQEDGEVRFEGRVPKGTRQEWKAKKRFVLRVSDPAALSLSLNGSPYSLPAPDASGDYAIEAP